MAGDGCHPRPRQLGNKAEVWGHPVPQLPPMLPAPAVDPNKEVLQHGGEGKKGVVLCRVGGSSVGFGAPRTQVGAGCLPPPASATWRAASISRSLGCPVCEMATITVTMGTSRWLLAH